MLTTEDKMRGKKKIPHSDWGETRNSLIKEGIKSVIKIEWRWRGRRANVYKVNYTYVNASPPHIGAARMRELQLTRLVGVCV